MNPKFHHVSNTTHEADTKIHSNRNTLAKHNIKRNIYAEGVLMQVICHLLKTVWSGSGVRIVPRCPLLAEQTKGIGVGVIDLVCTHTETRFTALKFLKR